MANIANGNIVRTTFFTSCQGQVAQNVLHHEVTTIVGGILTDAALAGDMSEIAAAVYRAYMPASCSYLGCRLQIVFPAVSPYVTSTTDAGIGANGTDVVPPQAAGLVQKLTAGVGSAKRGLVYLPFFQEADNSAFGEPDSEAIGFMVAWATQLLEPNPRTLGGITFTLVPGILSQSEVDPGWRVLTGYRVRSVWGTMRSRSRVGRTDNVGP